MRFSVRTLWNLEGRRVADGDNDVPGLFGCLRPALAARSMTAKTDAWQVLPCRVAKGAPASSIYPGGDDCAKLPVQWESRRIGQFVFAPGQGMLHR